MTLLKKMLTLAATMAFAAFVSTEAAAATSMAPDAFDALYATIAGWCKGTLGKSISLAFLVIGLSLGIIRGSIVAAVTCIAASLSLMIAPTILEAIFTVSGT